MGVYGTSEVSGTLAGLIRSRRTVRQFHSEPVPLETVIELMNVAVWAPTHGVREPWRFVLYADGAREELADAVLSASTAEERRQMGEKKKEYLLGIPVHLVVVLREDPRQRQWDEDYACVCCWIQNFQLAAWEAGLGVVWKTNPFIYHPAFREAVGAMPGEKVVGLLHIGYPELVPPERPRTDVREKLIVRDSV